MADNMTQDNRQMNCEAKARISLGGLARRTDDILCWSSNLRAISVEHEQKHLERSQQLLALLRGFQDTIDRAMAVPGVGRPSMTPMPART